MHIRFTNSQVVYRIEWRTKRKRHHMRTRRQRAARGPWVIMPKHEAQGETVNMLGFRTGPLTPENRT